MMNQTLSLRSNLSRPMGKIPSAGGARVSFTKKALLRPLGMRKDRKPIAVQAQTAGRAQGPQSNPIVRFLEGLRVLVYRLSTAFATAFALLMTAASPSFAADQRPVVPSAQDPATTSYFAPSRSGPRNQGTGILLAAAPAAAAPASSPEDEEAARLEYEKVMQKVEADARKRAKKPNDIKKYYSDLPKGYLPDDPLKPGVEDPNTIPTESGKGVNLPMSAWRPDTLRQMTYTQFWCLVRDNLVERVVYTDDRRAVDVTTKAQAPGGKRTERVGLPYDPELFDHLLSHGVVIEAPKPNPIWGAVANMVRLVAPIAFAVWLVRFSFKLGRKDRRDKIFGGARLELVRGKDLRVSFQDVAGVDQVKAEIQEIVTFLRDPKRFLKMGCRSPAGVLLVGPPGTGKTLLAKAIAGEAGVPFFSVAGTEFTEVFSGVGASRVRDMFDRARKNSPCILFIDEFDSIGRARSMTGASNDEGVTTINQLLTEMDGFENNEGVVVMAATNRPAALDEALTRPGRFDRLLLMPLPNLEGRVGILQVHARDKKVDPDMDWRKIGRATAGMTGADLMNLMNTAAIMAVRAMDPFVTEERVFEALEKIQTEKVNRQSVTRMPGNDEEQVPPLVRRQIAVYESAKALIGSLTPLFDEVSKVSVCVGGAASGFTYFIPQESQLESGVLTRGYLESRLVVSMAGRCAERLLFGPEYVSTAGVSDFEQANIIAREMVYKYGFGRRVGPISLMDTTESYLGKRRSSAVANISVETARVAMQDVADLLDAAEAKAYYGLVTNYRTLEAMVQHFMDSNTMSGRELQAILKDTSATPYPSPYTEGFTWDESGAIVLPATGNGKQLDGETAARLQGLDRNQLNGSSTLGVGAESPPFPLRNPYSVRLKVPELKSSAGFGFEPAGVTGHDSSSSSSSGSGNAGPTI